MPTQPPPERVSRMAQRAQVWVIMANDYPHLVKSTRQKAKRWVDKANKEQERALVGVPGGARVFSHRIYYRYYEATVDGGAIR